MRQPERVFEMLKRHEVQVLRKAGLSQSRVAEIAGVSERTVRAIEQEPVVADINDARERKKRKVGRPSKAEAFRAFAMAELAKQPGVISLELLRRARLRGYAGGKSAFYALVAALRPPKQEPIVRFEGVPGEFTQHDFGHVDVHFVDGSKKRIHFFASRLKYSRWVQVSIVPSEQVEPLVRTLVEHFDAMGGIPLLAVFDRPKTIALRWAKDGHVTEWNSTFAQVAFELGVGVEVCWPRSPRQKGSVESLVKWVKGSFFKPRRFVDDQDLEQQLAEWHVEVNTRLPSRATGVTPAERMLEERRRLRPLRVAPAELALRVPITVGPTGMVVHERQPYSMDPAAIGMPGTLYLYKEHVRIVAGRFESIHDRRREPGPPAQLPEHRAQMLAVVSGKRGRLYLQRQHLLELGPAALEYISELVHRRPRTWARDVERLHDLLQDHGGDVLLEAFAAASAAHTFGAEYVSHQLEGPVPRQELFDA